jgi:hypothetical protein
MHISIWQQFSSNHSADFTSVGRFDTETDAKRAAEEIRHILATIQAWYRQPENQAVIEAIDEEMGREGGSIPMPVEVELGKQYGIEWDEQFPDFLWYMDVQDATQAVVQFGNDVFVDSHVARARTWSGGNIIKRLYDKLGADVSFVFDAYSFDAGFQIRITWNAPDEVTADRLWQDYQKVQNTPDRWDATNLDVPQDVPNVYWGEDPECGLARDELTFSYRHCEPGIVSQELPELVDYLQRNGCINIRYDFEPRVW